MGQPTIKDVAKLAGVSISTVSRVMNDSKPVSPEARRKVLDAIAKLDFKPNQLARSLVMKKSNLIGVVVKDIGIEYMAQMIRGIEEVGRMYKYDIILSSTYGETDNELNAIEFLATKQVEGIIVISEDISPEVIVGLKEHRIPFMLLDKFYNFKKLTTVTIDFEKEEYNLIKFLNKLGHKKIAFIADDVPNNLTEKKVAGYKKAIEEIGEKSIIIRTGGNNSDAGYEIGDEVMEVVKKEGITAVASINDEVSIGFINYCYDQKISVPEDLSVAGFGDMKLASIYRPKLTTVQQPYYDIGAVAIRILIKKLKDEEVVEEDWVIPAQIMDRESTANI
ncbi:MAG: LacI family DNA-binding transcriptional regulator [Tissierellia bacterium]|nr:LacI family DNA-binding transcriptional regulator [Tissierellia bacterium]